MKYIIGETCLIRIFNLEFQLLYNIVSSDANCGGNAEEFKNSRTLSLTLSFSLYLHLSLFLSFILFLSSGYLLSLSFFLYSSLSFSLSFSQILSLCLSLLLFSLYLLYSFSSLSFSHSPLSISLYFFFSFSSLSFSLYLSRFLSSYIIDPS